jgi:Tfp pilus assembly protein PilO
MSSRITARRIVESFTESLVLPTWLTTVRVRITLCLLLIVMSVGYVVHMSSVSVSGYEIQKWERKIQTLTNEQQQLSVEIADMGSLPHIQKRLQEISMIPVENVRHIKAKDRAVAKK